LINLDDGMQLNEQIPLNILQTKFSFFLFSLKILFVPLIINELSFKKKLFKYFGINADNEAYARASLLKFK
jgi:hypothetical protein